MGVYINMEMPTSCSVCWALDDYGDYPRCHITEEQRGYNFQIREKRMDKCPLIPIPVHGRLIDADALLMRINHEGMEAYMDGVCYGVHPSQEYLDLLGEIIDDAPTIIPAEKSTDIQKDFMQNWHEEGE